MKNFTDKLIVVPWDFSDRSKAALRTAIDLAESIDQIEVVNVSVYPAAVQPGEFWGTFSEEHIADGVAKSFREEIADEFDVNLEFTTLFGDPGRQITTFAEENDAGLIVISSHGRTGIPRMLLGSVAERVIRLAHCPVLVLREAE